MNASAETKVGIGEVFDIEKFSNLEKLLRMTTYVVRFVNSLKAAVHKTDVVKEQIVVEELKTFGKIVGKI